MSYRRVEPAAAALMVEELVDVQHRDVAKYENRDHLDESAVFDLHTLAAHLYAPGFNEGRGRVGELGKSQPSRPDSRDSSVTDG